MRLRQARAINAPQPAGYPRELLALESLGLLSTKPGPDGETAASGRYVVVGGLVMFITAEVNHATALQRSGLPASADTVVGYYSAARAAAGAPWRFISIDHRLLLGSRVRPGEGSAAVAKAAFAASGLGDVSQALRR